MNTVMIHREEGGVKDGPAWGERNGDGMGRPRWCQVVVAWVPRPAGPWRERTKSVMAISVTM